MLYHFVVRVPRSLISSDNVFLRLCEVGWVGVELFFVLSGFLITGILLDTKSDSRYLSTFYMRRFLRIFPAYYALLVGTLIVAPLFLGNRAAESYVSVEKQWWFWCYLTNWLFAWEGGFNSTPSGYLWSLAVEEQFYLLWPLIVYALSARRLAALCCVLCIGTWVARPLLVLGGVPTTSIYTMTLSHADGLVLGSLIAVALREGNGETVIRFVRWAAIPALLVVIAVAVACNGRFVFYDALVASFGLSAVAILSAFGLCSALGTGRATWSKSLCESTALRQCGKYSYALYLLHVPVAAVLAILLLKPRSAGVLADWTQIVIYLSASFVLCGALALCSWFCFERPILSLKRYFRYGD
jgi:peptidoglycan/LPS O-acetylase OafA/YrhL